MTLVRQIGLISAGCQPWNINVVDSSGSRFAYAATLAIYIYEWNTESNQFYLHSIMSEHKKTITSIAWHLRDEDILASSSTDYKICIWHVSKRKLLSTLSTPHAVPSFIAWFPSGDDCLAYCDAKGPLHLWKYSEKDSSSPLKEISASSSNITQISWHPTAAGRFALGHADGTISLYLQGRKPQTGVKLGDFSPVSWLLWDPFSQNYLLICTTNGRLQLVDSSTDTASIITTYNLPSKAVTIKCAAWLTEAPGAFVTGDAEAGVLRIWTVSKETPQETLRLKQVGFKALCVLSSENAPKGRRDGMKFSSRIVCLFFDGGVGVYNLRNSAWDFLKNMGHLETIFDCQFKPDDPDLLATASFDGTIKVWNINTMEAVNSSHGDASIIYSLSWAPGDVNCIAAATSKSGVFIWNLKKGSIRKFGKIEKEVYFYCISWNQKDCRKIASGRGDGACMIYQTDGKLIQTYKHPAAVYGCDWNPNNESILATGCEDGNVRVFYVGSGTDQPLKILSGHDGKVFRVKWSPLHDGILCSTSDDCSVRVWNYANGSAMRVLEGHTSYTRGLLWCPELPNILISGSWDSSIRVWDISDGACLDVIEDHGADVYGLACHPQRPFVLTSTSRDSTVRLWSMLPLVSSLYLKILVSDPLKDLFFQSVNREASDFNERFGFHGHQSKILKSILTRENESPVKVWRAVSDLFCPPCGRSNLWDLLLILKNEEVDFAHYKNGIAHKKHIIKLTVAKALEKEIANVSFFGSGVNSCGKSENLKKAAEYHLLAGNLKKYCDIKVQLGEWMEALALAPGVSLGYWNDLATRWALLLSEDNSDAVAPFLIATNKPNDLVKHYIKTNLLEKAHVVSVAVSEGLLSSCMSNTEPSDCGNVENDDQTGKQMYENVRDLLAERDALCGLPVKSACWQLSDDNVEGALISLLRGNELELAISLCLSMGIQNSSFKTALKYLAWRCVYRSEWDLAIKVLNICPGTEIEKSCICINCELSIEERNDLHKKAGLSTVEEYKELAYEELKNKDNVFKIVQYHLLAKKIKKGLDFGLNYIKDSLEESKWNLESHWTLLYLMSCVNCQLLQDISFDKQRFELQVFSAYFGALIAIRQKFFPVVVPLFSTAVSLIRRAHNITLPLTEDSVSSEMHAWVVSNNSDSKFLDSNHNIYKDLMDKILEDSPFGDIGATIISGSNLPRHSDHHKCYLRGTAIRGPVFFLDDSKSAISINDALMWAKVNRFSPLKTGSTINPF